MKKINFLMVVLLFVGITSSYAQKNGIIGKGSNTNFIIGFPSASFGVEDGDEVADEYQLGVLWGIEWGNRWYFSPTETMGFGLMINWADISYSTKTGTENGLEWSKAVIDMTFMEIGPIGTYALSNNMAIDGYYNLRPTLLMSGAVVSDETFAYAGFGFSHAIGTAFRYNVFNVGLEYVFGGINSVGTYSGSLGGIDLDEKKNKTNSLRIMLGFKF